MSTSERLSTDSGGVRSSARRFHLPPQQHDLHGPVEDCHGPALGRHPDETTSFHRIYPFPNLVRYFLSAPSEMDIMYQEAEESLSAVPTYLEHPARYYVLTHTCLNMILLPCSARLFGTLKLVYHSLNRRHTVVSSRCPVVLTLVLRYEDLELGQLVYERRRPLGVRCLSRLQYIFSIRIVGSETRGNVTRVAEVLLWIPASPGTRSGRSQSQEQSALSPREICVIL